MLLSFQLFFLAFLFILATLKWIPQKVALLNKIHANILQLIKQKQIATLNKHEMLLTARDSFNCSHRYAKYLIVGLSLYKSNCRNETAALIINNTNDFLYSKFIN